MMSEFSESTEGFVFYNPQEMTKEQMILTLEKNDSEAICEMLIAMAYFEKDLEFCKNIILKCFASRHDGVRGNAVLCIGHIARIHRVLDGELPAIVCKGLKDHSEYVRGHAYSAFDDIDTFMPELAKELKKLTEN